jgi:hypothetical protein
MLVKDNQIISDDDDDDEESSESIAFAPPVQKVAVKQ